MDNKPPEPMPNGMPPLPDSEHPLSNDSQVIPPTEQSISSFPQQPTPSPAQQPNSTPIPAPISQPLTPSSVSPMPSPQPKLTQQTPVQTVNNQAFVSGTENSAQPYVPPINSIPTQSAASAQIFSGDFSANLPPQETQSQQPFAQNNATFGTMKPHRPRRKKLLVLGGVVVLLLLLGGGYIFAFYLPNQPDNVYKTAASRSGKALNQVVNKVTDKSKLDALKKSDITLSLNAKYGKDSFSGTFDAKFDASHTDTGLNFVAKSTGVPDKALTAKVLGEVPAGTQYPNIYFQLTGLKSFGLDTFLPGISDYDGKWIAITSGYLKSLGTVPTAAQLNKKTLTTDDFAELAHVATTTTVDYVFTTDSSKAVFTKKSFVGKEKVDGLSTYHYQVTLNTDHLKTYCKALVDSVYSTNAYKKLPYVDENNVDKEKDSAKKDCDSSSPDSTVSKTDQEVSPDSLKTYDLWIDAKYKLVYKVRIPDSSNKEAYTDVGQVYKGGDDVSLFVAFHDGKNKTDGKFTLDTNLNNSTSKGTLVITGGTGDNTYDFKMTLDAKPYTGEIKIEEPAGAIPFQDVLKRFGIDPKEFSSGTN